MVEKETMSSVSRLGDTRRRLAKGAVVAFAIAAFGTAGFTGALASHDDDDWGDWVFSGASGSGIFGDDFPTGGSGIFDDDFASGGSGGDINFGGASGGSIVVGSGGSGGIMIGDDSGHHGGNSGPGGGGNSGHGGGDDYFDD